MSDSCRVCGKVHCQSGEREYILDALGIPPDTYRMNDGRFLDIGGWHAESLSNTRELAEMGWSGVLVEPSPGPLKGLIAAYADRPDIIVVGGAVTVGAGFITMAITDDATSQEPGTERFEDWKKYSAFYGTMSVRTISLQELFEHFGGDFEMVSIDVEGQSLDLLAEMIRIGPRPRCVVVEHDGRHVELAQVAERGHYGIVTMNGNNTILRWRGERE